MVTRTSFFTSLTLLLTVPAHATILVDQSDPYLQYFVGGSNLTDFTAALAATPGGYTIGSVANAADVSAAGSVLVGLRSNLNGSDVLSSGEQTNLRNALSAGKHVVLIGENGLNWSGWDNSILLAK